MFCGKCGAENPDDENFCVKCGNDLSKIESNISKTNENIQEDQVQKITIGFVISWIFGLLFGLAAIVGFLAGDYAPAFVILLISIIILPPFTRLFKEKFNFELSRGLKIAVIFILILITGSVVPDTTDPTTIKPSDDSQQTPIETEQKSTPILTSKVSLITKAPSDIGLTINDLPTGWMGRGEGNETYYSSSFDQEKIGFHTIECEVTKYSTVDEAKQAFSKLKQEYSDFKLSSVGLGDDSFGWEFGPESVVVFRKANVVVDFWYYREYGNSHIRDIKKYAEIVEKKIL